MTGIKLPARCAHCCLASASMRLLIATPLYPPEPGGPATYAKLLADHLPERGVEVAVVKFACVRRRPKVWRHLAYLRLLIMEGKEADVILVLDPVSTGLPAAAASIILAKPLVAKIVGDYAWEQARQHGITATLDDFVQTTAVPIKIRALRMVQRWVARRARMIIVPSNYLRNIVSSWGLPQNKITVIYNAVPDIAPGPLPHAAATQSQFTIVTVGRLVPWKHVDGIIAALDQLPEAHLTIVGDGPEQARLQALAQSNSKIHFAGPLPNGATQAIMERADALVLNSSYEGLSHVLIEGLMLGLPIIATRAGGNEEVLTGDCGILVPVEDTAALTAALRSLIDDPALRSRLRAAARERAASFSTDAMLSATLSVLEQAKRGA